MTNSSSDGTIEYEKLAETFNQALIVTLRKHNVGDSFLDYWVPDADPVLGIAGMVDSARLSGRTEIAVQFMRTTVPADRTTELEQAVGRFAKVKLEQHDGRIVLHATGMAKNVAAPVSSNTSRKDDKPSYWQANQLAARSASTSPPNHWNSDEFPEFKDVHPHFRAGLKAALTTLTHESNAGPESPKLVRLEGREGSICLALYVDSETHLVHVVRHTGAFKPSEKVALDLFCRTAEGLPFQEVADHVGLRVIDSLIDEDKATPVPGVLLPINAGKAFMLAPRLARQAYDAYRVSMAIRKETNFYYAPPSEQWMALSNSDRCGKVAGGLRGFLQSEELYPDDLELLRLEKNKYGYEVRSVISFSDRIKVGDKPFLLRRLEHRLRRDVEAQIELVADRAKDSSPLRRLS